MAPPFTDVFADVTTATRALAKDRRFTIAAIVALGLAIGVNNSVFALINAALIRELPFDEPDRLVAVGLTDGRGVGGLSYPDYVDWRDGTTAFEGLAATMNTVMNVSDSDVLPERFRGAYISANAFRLLRVAPVLGRDFRDEDDRVGAPAVVLLGYGMWQRRYGGDPGVLGRSVRINEIAATVIGVMPPGFTFPFINELWQPLSVAPAVIKPRRDVPILEVFGRLVPDATTARAQSELQTIAERLAREFPGPGRSLRPVAISMREDYRVRSPLLGVFMGAVGLVLLVACANLAHLLLSRSVTRSRDFAIRTSLGASRWRLVRYLLIESAVIAALAAVLGMMLSMYGANAVAVAFEPIEPGAAPGSTRPFWLNLSIDATMVLFIGGLALFAAVMCGLLPALHVFKIDANAILKDGGRNFGSARTRRWMSTVLVVEIAMTAVLLVGTGLLWRSFVDRYQRDVVIDTSHLMVMRLGLPAQRYATDAARAQFYRSLEERLTGLSTIASFAVANAAPFELSDHVREVALDTDTSEPPALGQASMIQTGRDYFATLGVPIIRGRAFAPEDWAAANERVIVDEQFAARFLAGRDPIGRRIRLLPRTGQAVGQPQAPTPWLTIVGVSRALPHFGRAESRRPTVYVPIGPTLPLIGAATIIVRGTDPAGATHAVRQAVRALDSNLPLHAIETMDSLLARTRYPVRLVGTWFAIIAGIALVLVSVGLYALTAQSVAQRTQEIGVRMALGARASQVVWLFTRQSFAQLLIGLVIGLSGAAAAGKLLQSYLDQISPRDPVTLGAVCVTLIAVSLVATVVPARRAARVDPVVTLRSE